MNAHSGGSSWATQILPTIQLAGSTTVKPGMCLRCLLCFVAADKKRKVNCCDFVIRTAETKLDLFRFVLKNATDVWALDEVRCLAKRRGP